MDFVDIPRHQVFDALKKTGARQCVVDRVAEKIGRHKVKMATDGTWLVLVAGDHVGTAKRTTYPPRADEWSPHVAVSIAASRL